MTATQWRWILPLTALLIGIVFGAYGSDLLGGSRSKANATDAVKAMTQQQAEAWNKGDVKGYMSHYEMSDAITFYSDDVVSAGWVAVSDRYTKSYVINKKPMGQLTFSEETYTPFSGDAVMVRGRWTLTLDGPPRTGLFTILVQKTDNGWKIVHDHTSERKEAK